MPETLDLAVIALNLLAGAGVATMLGVLSWIRWEASRTATRHNQTVRILGHRMTPALWALIFVVVTTGVYGQANNASLQLPNIWEVAVADENQGYALLSLGVYLLITQVMLGMGALTINRSTPAGKVRAAAGPQRDRASDLGAALISTLSLAATLIAVIAMAAIDYLQVLAHTLA